VAESTNETLDPVVAKLAQLFAQHPAWVTAAQKLEPEATSGVFFHHLPGEAWRLERCDGETHLLAGAARDPDLVFRFSARAVDRLAAVDGGIGDFAVELFRLITEPDEDLRVGFRVAVAFPRLLRRGYLSVLGAGGWRVLAFGAARGVRTVAQLRALVEALSRNEPEPWERSPGLPAR